MVLVWGRGYVGQGTGGKWKVRGRADASQLGQFHACVCGDGSILSKLGLEAFLKDLAHLPCAHTVRHRSSV